MRTLFIFGFLLAMNISTKSQEKSLTYLALGDSYTIGEGVAEDLRFPMQLASQLKNVEKPIIVATTGWTTEELKEAIETAKLKGTYDIVTLLIGVNNQYRGYSTEVYRKEFRELLKMAIQFANNDPKKVFVVSIPDWGVTPFAEGRDRVKIAQEIDIFNATNKAETKILGAHYTDITPVSRTLGTNPNYLAEDGLHPSGKMYTEWVNLLYPTVRLALK